MSRSRRRAATAAGGGSCAGEPPSGVELVVACTPLDALLLEAMIAAGAFGSRADVARTALYRFAVHLGFDPPLEAFAVRDTSRSARGRAARRVVRDA